VKLNRISFFAALAFSAGLNAQNDASSLDFSCSKLDDQGVLWIGSLGEGLWKVQGNSIEAHTVVGHAPRADFYAMTQDPQGHLWLATKNGLIEYDYVRWKDIPMSGPYVASTQNVAAATERNRIVHGLAVNHMDHVLMGVEDATTGQKLLMRFNGQTYVDLIKPFKATAVYEDLDAMIWMAGGGYKMEGGKLVSKVSLPQGTITCALQDSRGDVWVGIDGSGVYRYDGTSIRHYGEDHGFTGIGVTCMHEDKKGKVWMGVQKLGGDKEQSVSYFEAGAFHHLEDSPDCPVQSVNTIASDKKGMVWFAGNDGALYRYNGRSFTTIDTSRFLENR
jgi:ligand-binding sensor domain-containing protein